MTGISKRVVPDEVQQLLEASDVEWWLENRKKHVALWVEDEVVGWLSHGSTSNVKRRTVLNCVARVKRKLRQLKESTANLPDIKKEETKEMNAHTHVQADAHATTDSKKEEAQMKKEEAQMKKPTNRKTRSFSTTDDISSIQQLVDQLGSVTLAAEAMGLGSEMLRRILKDGEARTINVMAAKGALFELGVIGQPVMGQPVSEGDGAAQPAQAAGPERSVKLLRCKKEDWAKLEPVAAAFGVEVVDLGELLA